MTGAIDRAFPHPPPDARAGLAALCAADPDLGRIEPAAGPLPWRTRPPGFPGLLQAIVGQQISNQAAAAIWRRLRALPGALDPATLLDLPDEALRGVGLSRPKVAHAKSLAGAFRDGVLAEAALGAMDDASAVAAIGAVRGLGPWTAEIYLLFALGRPDVFPAGDLALAAACADLKRLPARPKPAALRAIAARWQPYRALAARLLWHHWRHVTGRPAMDDFSAVFPAGHAT
jgi:DNA-3-methyladenine glycosylase II